jgi:hypothetical protein
MLLSVKPRKTKAIKHDPVSINRSVLGSRDIPYNRSTGGDATWYGASEVNRIIKMKINGTAFSNRAVAD